MFGVEIIVMVIYKSEGGNWPKKYLGSKKCSGQVYWDYKMCFRYAALNATFI